MTDPKPALDRQAIALSDITTDTMLRILRLRGHLVFVVSPDSPPPGFDWDAYPGGWEGWLGEQGESLENDICQFIHETLDNRAANSDVPVKEDRA